MPNIPDKTNLSRLNELLNEVKSSGNFFRLFDGQSQEITFDLNTALGTRTRTIRTRDGENQRQITRMTFIIWNHRFKRYQYFELARRWTTKAVEAMRDFNRTSLIVTRTGSGIWRMPAPLLEIRNMARLDKLG